MEEHRSRQGQCLSPPEQLSLQEAKEFGSFQVWQCITLWLAHSISSLNVSILSDEILNTVFIGTLFDFMVGNVLENVQKMRIKLFYIFRHHGITL